jgi:Tol biopolymer transport system component
MQFLALVGIAALCALAVLAISMTRRGDAAYPGLNGKVVYTYGDSIYNTAIWSVNADGTGQTQLTAGPSDYSPSYSANGTRIAFNRASSLVVMNADGSGQTVLFPGSSSNSSSISYQSEYQDPHSPKKIDFVKIETFTSSWDELMSPSFSPDGTQLAVSHNSGTRIQKHICAVATGNEDEDCIGYSGSGAYSNYESSCNSCSSNILTVSSTTGAVTGTVTAPSTTIEDYDPTYSVTGQVAFTRWQSGVGSRIFVGSIPVTAGPSDGEPNFSPDGTRIVFRHSEKELGIVGAGGGPVTILPVPPIAGAKYSYIGSPAFSPDGTRIVFNMQGYTEGFGPIGTGLYTIGSTGAGLTPLFLGQAYSPDWQAVPPPPPLPPPVPPKGVSPKGKVRLDKHNKAVVGTIVCGSSPCTLKVLSAKLKAGKKKYGVGAKLPKTLKPTKKGKLTITVAGKALAALKKAKKGDFVGKVSVTDATGKKVLTLKSKVLPPKAKPKKKHKGK